MTMSMNPPPAWPEEAAFRQALSEGQERFEGPEGDRFIAGLSRKLEVDRARRRLLVRFAILAAAGVSGCLAILLGSHSLPYFMSLAGGFPVSGAVSDREPELGLAVLILGTSGIGILLAGFLAPRRGTRRTGRAA